MNSMQVDNIGTKIEKKIGTRKAATMLSAVGFIWALTIASNSPVKAFAIAGFTTAASLLVERYYCPKCSRRPERIEAMFVYGLIASIGLLTLKLGWLIFLGGAIGLAYVAYRVFYIGQGTEEEVVSYMGTATAALMFLAVGIIPELLLIPIAIMMFMFVLISWPGEIQ